ncbi:hypothetical protein A9G17_07380 [Gilliamella sp. wkB7]|nr:hypothetical protein A9G17_07380 [Gilliamella apicola]
MQRRSNALILLLVYIFLSSILAYIHANKNDSFIVIHFLLILSTTSCLFLIIHTLIKSRRHFFVVIGTLFLFLFLSEINYLIYFGEVISEGVLDSITETNSYEAFSMLKPVLFITVPALIVTVGILFIYKKFITVKFRPILPLTLYIVIGSIFISVNTNVQNDTHKDYRLKLLILREFYPAVLGNIVYLGVTSFSTDIYADTSEIEVFNDAIILPPQNLNDELVVLIMGESSLVSRYSAYGYHKLTTPLMAEVFNQKNGGCIINNSHSSASFTRDSIPMTLSFSIPESNDNLFNNKSIIEMAKYNNYKTYWLASYRQNIKGASNAKFGFIARKSDILDFTDKDHDVNLSELLERYLKKDNAPKKFIFIHLRGSHQPYSDGYDEIDKQALPDAEDYDLTIHHTDRTVKAIYDVINKYSRNYSIIYTSDHGEIVNLGHGMSKGIDQFLIPFMFISKNNQFDCQFIESYRGSNGYLSGLMNKYILSNLLGYQIDQSILDKEKNNDRILLPNHQNVIFSDYLKLNKQP